MKNPLSIDSKSYFQADFSAQPTNLAQDTRIAERLEVKSSLRGSEATEAIYESKKMDCHDSTQSVESRNDDNGVKLNF